MANPAHVEILLQGVDAWNKWKGQCDGAPDLEGADLRGIDFGEVLGRGLDLSYMNLSNVKFNGAKLHGAVFLDSEICYANFCGADLNQAMFLCADLSHANLRAATLDDAELTYANLTNADLTGADLSFAVLTGANLQNVIAHSAIFDETIFADTLLKNTKHLETCVHRGPSVIDYRTIAKSGDLPLPFLRGCGLPDDLIEYFLPNILKPANQYHSCFISYSQQDEDFAKRLHADLRDNGVLCWFAPHKIQGGKKIYDQIEQAIRSYERVLLILSEHSINSEWVKSEITNARQRELTESKQILFPIRLVNYEAIKKWKYFDSDLGKDTAREVREYFVPDFSNWKDYDSYLASFNRLLRDLKTIGPSTG